MSTITSPSNPVLPRLRLLPPDFDENDVRRVESGYERSIEWNLLIDSGEYELDLALVQERCAYREACMIWCGLVFAWLVLWSLCPYMSLVYVIIHGIWMTATAFSMKWILFWTNGRRFYARGQGRDPAAPNYNGELNPFRIRDEARMWRSRPRWRCC